MPVVLSIQSRLRQGGLAWRKRGIVRGCKPGAAGKYRIAGWANTWRNETDCSGRRNQAVALPRRGTLERPNSGGRPLSAVGIRTLPPGLVESSLPRRLHCGSRNHPQRMGMVEGGTIRREGSGFGGSSRTSSLDPAVPGRLRCLPARPRSDDTRNATPGAGIGRSRNLSP